MDLKQMKDLMAAMGRTGTKKLAFKTQEFELKLEREGEPVYQVISGMQEMNYGSAKELEAARHQAGMRGRHDIPASLATPVGGTEKPQEEGSFIKSPMVGTFYSASTPDEAPFVKVGEKVDKDTIVCIVEAMKVMNEVKAGISGTVKEVLAENGHPVEFGTKLFKIV